jgi:GNAT superfamily N-acetyltransferase
MDRQYNSNVTSIRGATEGFVKLMDGKEILASAGFYVGVDGVIEIGPDTDSAIMVSTRHRREGLGRQIAEETLRLAIEVSNSKTVPTKAIMKIADSNRAAQGLAESLGYKKIGEDYMDPVWIYELSLAQST